MTQPIGDLVEWRVTRGDADDEVIHVGITTIDDLWEPIGDAIGEERRGALAALIDPCQAFGVIELRLLATASLTDTLAVEIRELLDEAFKGEFSDEDWAHSIGGVHAVVTDDGRVIAHGSVVERTLVVGDRPVHTGYVEGVATVPERQGEGRGSRVMVALGEMVAAQFEMGALSTGEHEFYERLGWERWRGPTFVRRTNGSVVRTAEEDDGIMILRIGADEWLDPTMSLTCEERPGDDW